ncbi:glycosyltransferase family 2 protein [Thermotoga sp. Xyl54]|uniref:glycosyltransferase family 2 protein n=2 Tax=Thermotoga TaxID=2335 RepID=UPI00138E36D3|nr:glycosyltransferase family 2 protein [Thermotoga sp. Xyl54]
MKEEVRYMFVSFVIPAYNVEKYISRTLRSLLSQTDRDLEIIVVNDGSTDQTEQVAYEVLSNSGFKNYKIISKENGGPSSARNRGLKEAQGQYVIFLDGDDYIAPTLVEELKKASSIEKADVFCWKFLMVDESGSALKKQFPWQFSGSYNSLNGFVVLRKILIEKQLWIWTGSAAYSRDFLNRNGLVYDERYYTGEDLAFEWEVLLKNPKVLVINKVLSFYVQHPGSITKMNDFKLFDFYFAINKLCEDYKGLKTTNEFINDILQAIKEWSLFNFLYNVRCYLERNSITAGRFLKNLRQNYPRLYQLVLSDVKSIKRLISKVTFRQKIYFWLFKISPYVSLNTWSYLSRLKKFFYSKNEV